MRTWSNSIGFQQDSTIIGHYLFIKALVCVFMYVDKWILPGPFSFSGPNQAVLHHVPTGPTTDGPLFISSSCGITQLSNLQWWKSFQSKVSFSSFMCAATAFTLFPNFPPTHEI